MVWCTLKPARLARCTATANGWMDPASSQLTVSGIGTVMDARHVTYWQRVPSVGSRPQYFRLEQVLVFPLMQNSHLVHPNRQYMALYTREKWISAYSMQAKPGSTATLWPTDRSLTSFPTLMMIPEDSCPRMSSRETLSLSQLWQSEPQMPVVTISTRTSLSFGGTIGRCWIASCLWPVQTTARFDSDNAPLTFVIAESRLIEPREFSCKWKWTGLGLRVIITVLCEIPIQLARDLRTSSSNWQAASVRTVADVWYVLSVAAINMCRTKSRLSFRDGARRVAVFFLCMYSWLTFCPGQSSNPVHLKLFPPYVTRSAIVCDLVVRQLCWTSSHFIKFITSSA